MKKVIGILLGLLTLSIFTGFAWLLYQTFGSTVIVILNVVIVMIGLLLALIVYTKYTGESVTAIHDTTMHYPAIERGKILVNVQGFCDKIEVLKGDLYLITQTKIAQNLTLKKGEYNKLLDEFTLFYSDGVKTKMRGVKSVGVGDYQFMIYDFEELIHFNGKYTTHWRKERNKVFEKTPQGTTEHSIPKRSPVYIFDWSSTNTD